MTATAIPAVVALRPPVAARRLLTAYFAGMGALMAVWGARMPAVQAVAHLSTGQLSIVLLAAAVGMVAGLQAGGIWAHRHGPARLLTAPAVGLALVLVLLGQGRTLPELATLALLFGLVHGVLDVGANAAAVRCQDRYRRPIMSSLHCGYSAGALCGAALAALTAHLAHSVVFAVFGITAALAALVAAPATRNIADLGTETHQSHASTQPPATKHPRSLLWLLGGLAASSLLGEGAAADWAAVHVHDLGGQASIAAAAFAAYSAAMAAGRLIGDRLTSRYGPATVVRAGALLAAIGFGSSLMLDSVTAAIAGWTALGLGLSVTVPCLITAAGTGGPRAVAAVAATGYLGLLAGPAVIGALASWITLPAALALPAVLTVGIAATARRALESR
ncbi:MFS transporter (plasmid) [Actinacidiphila glaucinigra]|uniref:MFS transporter n=1 Tax=Actinacidiphila glaucinigra TaxID=235986 RepID=UPI002DDB320F|nr:MFS transporter [Actinacidiphila glaucinigra]WSD65891.1 MFS transporter [Actinacidiphila glaucinigra]